jgi:hypothetical protein
VRYAYDAAGRLTHRLHLGALPEGQTDEALRPFIDQRRYEWEGATLLVESSYGPEGTEASLRWRKKYVPGASGLDDAVQIVVEQGGQSRTYTPIRDELNSVLAIVADNDRSHPRSSGHGYSPYRDRVASGPRRSVAGITAAGGVRGRSPTHASPRPAPCCSSGAAPSTPRPSQPESSSRETTTAAG